MNIDEAKRLKTGDKVLVEIHIDSSSVFDEYGNICLESAYVRPEDVREKIVPPRRKFRARDIVETLDGHIYIAVEDEDEDGDVNLATRVLVRSSYYEKAENLTLLLAVEDRADRPAAADGSGVASKGDNN